MLNMRMHHIVATVGLAAILGTTPARADDTQATAVTGNVELTSDYIFRGLTQSWGKPAVQGGADLAAANGFAAGVWGSSISEHSYPGGAVELDLYGSYGRSINADWSWRAGLYGYFYPGANFDHAGLPARALNTGEANLALSWKQWALKYSYALTDYFGADREEGYRGNSKGTSYLMLEGAIPLDPKWSLTLHLGYTFYSTGLAAPNADGARDPSYADIGVGAKYAINAHWTLLGVVTHATNDRFYRHTASFQDAADTLNVGGTNGLVMLQGSF
ncbi:TorF family putative porin [Rhodanobacter thiooxydans]|nr:TorF family putative porin [Rhodanobacter thiooxydans]